MIASAANPVLARYPSIGGLTLSAIRIRVHEQRAHAERSRRVRPSPRAQLPSKSTSVTPVTDAEPSARAAICTTRRYVAVGSERLEEAITTTFEQARSSLAHVG